MSLILLDNDMAAKATAYSLLEEMSNELLSPPGKFGVLGSLIFVINQSRLRKASDGGEQAHLRLTRFVASATVIEPSDEETMLAAELEDLARTNRFQFDTGESQLIAVAILRGAPMVCTGDKRAVAALERLRLLDARIAMLDGKVISLESLVRQISSSKGHDYVRRRVCASLGTDIAVEICYQCLQEAVSANDIEQCLLGYTRKLRLQAPSICGELN